MPLSVLTDHRAERLVIADFRIADAAGRAMGARLTLEVRTYEAAEAGATGARNIAPGSYYVFTPHATRNGKRFGRVQADRHFATESERASAISLYLRAAVQRAAARAGQ